MTYLSKINFIGISSLLQCLKVEQYIISASTKEFLIFFYIISILVEY